MSKTDIDGVRVFRDPYGSPKQPLLYQSGIIIMLQGTKRLYVDNREIEYKKAITLFSVCPCLLNVQPP